MIAVTGANGLLGSFVIRKLIENGDSFIALCRADSDISLLHDVSEKITWRNADILDPLSLADALRDVTHVVHAAAVVSFNPREEEKIMESNVTGTRNVVDACLATGVKRLIHISSVAALGRQKGQTKLDENNKWVDSSLNSTYAKSKYLGELEVFRGQEEGLSIAIVNPSVILAPADWKKSSAQLFKYVWDSKSYYIDGTLNYVDVRDVAHITCALLRANNTGERFIASAGSMTYLGFFTQLAGRFETKPPRTRLSRRMLRIVAFLEGIRSRILNTEPLLTSETARLAGAHFVYSNEKVRKTLNFEFQSIDHSLQWCCDYYIARFGAKK